MSGRALRPTLAATLAALTFATVAGAQSIYWVDTNFPSPRLGRANADGTNPGYVPLPAGTLPEGLAVDGVAGQIYFVEAAFTDARVRRAGTATLGFHTDLVTGGSVLRGVDLDLVNGKIYWTSSNLVTGSRLHRSNLDGSSAVVLVGAAGSFRDVVVVPASDRVYVADYADKRIHRFTLAGLPAGGPLPTEGVWGLAWHAATQTLYFTEYDLGQIRSAQPAMWAPVVRVTGLARPTHLAIDAAGGKMYWSEAETGLQKIQRANLNGTSVQNLGLPVATYGGVAIGPLVTTDIPGEGEDESVTEFALGAAMPNPASGLARIRYAVGREAHVSIRVFDVQGREVATLFDGVRAPGRYEAVWDGRSGGSEAPAGLYFIRFRAPDRDRVTRLVWQR
jgi:hypothetical protein